MAADVSQAFSLDVNSISRLKYSSRGDSKDSVKQVAQQFEAMFLQQMLKSMREAMPKGGLTDSQQGDTYQQMMDGQWSQTLAKRGMGLADMLTRALEKRGSVKDSEASDAETADPLAAFSHGTPRALSASDPVDRINAARAAAAALQAQAASQASASPQVTATGEAHPLFSLAAGNAAANATAGNDAVRAVSGDGSTPDYVSRFVARMGPAADRVASQTGLPRRLILAQAALESGWGRHEISTADGSQSFNVFNIKSTGWQGASTSVNTTEYSNGTAQATRAGFRVYGSYDQAFADYARLLSSSPRYAPVLHAATAQAAARALQDSGYATDPAYADKLVSIMDQLPADADTGSAPLIRSTPSSPVVDMARVQAATAGQAMSSLLPEATDESDPLG